MCRFLIYKGRDLLMADLLTRSDQSLIRQSFKARERKEPLNGDGFGVGWYVPEIDPTPCVFTSVSPAWSNRNLQRLSEKTLSGCVMAHVRAATPGIYVSEANCHPFQYDRFLWMHNGRIADFRKIRRRLLQSVDDALYDRIEGTTDSEYAFALFMNRLLPDLNNYDLDLLVEVMIATLGSLRDMTKEAGIGAPSFCNFALTDGENVVVTRYVDSADVQPPSLYLSTGARFENIDGVYHMRPASERVDAVIVASEPLTDDRSDWQSVQANHVVAISPNMEIRQIPIS